MTNYLDSVDSEWFSGRLSIALTVVVAAFVVLIARLFTFRSSSAMNSAINRKSTAFG